MVGNITNKISFFLRRGYLLNPDILKIAEEGMFDELEERFEPENRPIDLTKDIKGLVENKKTKFDLSWNDFEKARVDYEKGDDDEVYLTFMNVSSVGGSSLSVTSEIESEPIETEALDNSISKPIILKNYSDKDHKVEVPSFVSYYKIRYDYLRKILQTRNGLGDAVSINRLQNKRKGEKVSTIGMVYSKSTTKNGHIIIEMEDITGMTKVLMMKTKDELYNSARDIVCDEIIGMKGVKSDGLIFADEIFFPEFPPGEGIKKGNVDEYVAFISDLHVGSDVFMEENFLKFISWINGEYGTKDQKDAGLKVKYLFIVGDLVDGVGIYPGQDSDLDISDITEQYDRIADYLSKIRKDVQIVACPGNHDAVRLAEPQPSFDTDLCNPLSELENVTLVTNPSVINMGATKDFDGFNVLLYHGNSFDFYVRDLETLREAGGYDCIDYLMKLILKKRHLSPTHDSFPSMVDVEEDPLIILDLPDFFATGHIHRSKVAQLEKTTLISGSCWQPMTEFQEKTGHIPEPARVPIVNLKTREIKVMKFTDD